MEYAISLRVAGDELAALQKPLSLLENVDSHCQIYCGQTIVAIPAEAIYFKCPANLCDAVIDSFSGTLDMATELFKEPYAWEADVVLGAFAESAKDKGSPIVISSSLAEFISRYSFDLSLYGYPLTEMPPDCQKTAVGFFGNMVFVTAAWNSKTDCSESIQQLLEAFSSSAQTTSKKIVVHGFWTEPQPGLWLSDNMLKNMAKQGVSLFID